MQNFNLKKIVTATEREKNLDFLFNFIKFSPSCMNVNSNGGIKTCFSLRQRGREFRVKSSRNKQQQGLTNNQSSKARKI